MTISLYKSLFEKAAGLQEKGSIAGISLRIFKFVQNSYSVKHM